MKGLRRSLASFLRAHVEPPVIPFFGRALLKPAESLTEPKRSAFLRSANTPGGVGYHRGARSPAPDADEPNSQPRALALAISLA